MTNQPKPIDTTNPHATEARAALEGSTKAENDETAAHLVTRAVALAGLAQAYEARTASLQRYYDSLFHGDGAKHHEQQHAAAVLALIRERLGLTSN